MALSLGQGKKTPSQHYEVIDLEKFCEGGLFRERVFREKVKSLDWEKMKGKEVLVKGCGNIPIPTWAYMAVAVEAARVAQVVLYGETANPILIHKTN